MLDAFVDLALGGTCACCGARGRVLCHACEQGLPSGGVPASPDPRPLGLAPVRVAGSYASPLRELVLAHKEHRAFGLARPLGSVLAGVIDSAVPADDALLVLVPVPSRRAVVRSRGHDPLERTVRRAASALRPRRRVRVVALLRQLGTVADQAGLDAEQRAANLAGRLAVLPRARARLAALGAVRVVLCDDVVTTGATVREAQRALEAAGVPVAVIAALAATRRRRGDSG